MSSCRDDVRLVANARTHAERVRGADRTVLCVTNPFDVPDSTFAVLTNSEGQHSLWPSFADTPAGWAVAYGPASRGACIEYVTANWTDLRPRSLITGTDP
jgi:MbtH protein